MVLHDQHQDSVVQDQRMTDGGESNECCPLQSADSDISIFDAAFRRTFFDPVDLQTAVRGSRRFHNLLVS
jgi:hypothetical protein